MGVQNQVVFVEEEGLWSNQGRIGLSRWGNLFGLGVLGPWGGEMVIHSLSSLEHGLRPSKQLEGGDRGISGGMLKR